MSALLTRRTVALGLAASAMAGCGGRRAASTATAATPLAAAGVVFPPRFGEADPVDWPGRAPSAYPIHGVDVSRFQGAPDWRTLRREGTNFAFLKATEGGDRTDEAFARNWAETAAAGIPRAAYHFYYFCTDAATQARWFIANVPRRAGDLPPVLDLEWNPHSPTCTLRPPPGTVRSEAARFLSILTGHYGRRPIIYTTPDFYRTNDIGRLGGEFWLRAVTEHPTTAYPGQDWTFWQYSGTGRADGVRGRIDLNAFNGPAERWHAWRAARQIA